VLFLALGDPRADFQSERSQVRNVKKLPRVGRAGKTKRKGDGISLKTAACAPNAKEMLADFTVQNISNVYLISSQIAIKSQFRDSQSWIRLVLQGAN
jgi:hypothetical protein